MTYFCDWGPYFKSQTGNKFREFPSATAADWTGVTLRSDDTRTIGALAAGSTATWTAQDALSIVEALAELVLIPGQYESTAIDVQIYRARVNTSTGQLILSRAGVDVVTVALPASVWTNSATFGSCWLRCRWEAGKNEAQARVWSVNEPEPTAWTAIHAATSFITTIISPQIGWPGASQPQAFGWYSVTSNLGACPTPRRASDRNYYDKWLAVAHKQGGSSVPRVMTLEVFAPAVKVGAPTLRAPGVMRAATQDYNSGGAWPFDNQRFPATMLNWPKFDRKLPETIVGRQAITAGTLRIANANGINDRWIRAHNIRAVAQLRYGDPSWPFYDLRAVFTGEVANVSDAGGAIDLQLRDGMSRFDRLVEQTLTAGDGGRPIPRCLGECYNVSPLLTAPSTLTYTVDSLPIQAVTAVRDRGVTLTTAQIGVLQSFDAAADTLRFRDPHGLLAGESFTPTGAVPGGMTSGVEVFVHSVIDAWTVKVSATFGGPALDLTGTDSYTVSATFPAANRIRTAVAHNYTAGASFQIRSGTPPGGAALNTNYFAISAGLTANELSFSLTSGGAAVDLTASTTLAVTFVNDATNTLNTSAAVPFSDNQALAVEGASLPTPLSQGVYFRGPTTYTFAVELRATSGGAVIDLTDTTLSAASVSNNQSGYVVTRWLGATVSASAFVANPTAGTFRLRANPAGQITCDVQGERVGATYSASAAHAVRVLLGDNSGVHDAFRTGAQWSFAIGLAITERANLGDLLDQLAEATQSVWGVNRLGVFVARSIYAFSSRSIDMDRDPLALPKILSKRLPADAYVSLPVWRKNYTVQSPTDLASGLSAADVAQWGKDFLQEGAIAAPFPLVDNGTQGARLDVRRDTSIGVSSGGSFSFPTRQTLSVQVTLLMTALDAFELGREVQLVTTRDALNDGGVGQTLVTGIAEDFENGAVTLTLLRPIVGFFPPNT